jgi:hypothetical protein
MTAFTGSYYEPLLDEVHDSFRAAFDRMGHSKVAIIYSDMNTLEPKGTYCTISPLQISQIGKRDESTLIEPTTETITTSTHFKLYLQLMFTGDNAGSVATHIQHSLMNNRRAFDEFHKRNISVLNKTDIRRNPRLRETKWVDNFAFDLNLTFSIFTRYTYDWVEYITTNGEIFKIPYNEQP